MGHTRCLVPGCPTRLREGKRFKCFPKDESLRALWLTKLPTAIKVTKSSAICEDHFDLDQFEKLRQDGRKQLKERAVPSLRLSLPLKAPRRTLGDASSALNIQPQCQNILDHSYFKQFQSRNEFQTVDARPAPPARVAPSNVQECVIHDDVTGPLQHAAPAPTCSNQDDDKENQAIEINSGEIIWHFPSAPAVNSNLSSLNTEEFFPSAPAVIPNLSSFNTEGHTKAFSSADPQDGILDEETGLFQPFTVVTPPPSISYGTDENSQVPCSNLETSTNFLILDDKSGYFTPASIDQSNDSNVDMPFSPLEDMPSTPERLSYDDLLKIMAQQSAEIERLNKIAEEKDNRLQELINGFSFSNKFKKQYDACRKSKERLEESMRRNSYSPWLSNSQYQRLMRKSTRGVKWDIESIRDGLILRMKCGTSGYSAFVQKYPLLPAIRTLTESVRFIRFDSGLLSEVFNMLEVMVKGMRDIQTDCQIVCDEMAIQEGTVWDHALKKFVGKTTLPTHEGNGTRALTFILAGIADRWKVTVAVFFTNKKSQEAKKQTDNPTGRAYADIIDKITERSERIGLKICAVVSDMGPDNLAYWRHYGVTGGRKKEVQLSFPNPVRNSQVFILPDPIHLLKAMKTMLESNKVITLPDDFVKEEGLSSAEVHYKHVDDLYQFESGSELKVAFRLKESNVRCNKQFKKMKVSTTKAVLCHRTGVGLKLLSKERNDPSIETTATFILFLNTFFTLITCRHKGMAISKHNKSAFEKAINMIKRMDHIFLNMKVGSAGEWKPVQRGMRVLCHGLLSLIDYFLNVRQYSYLILGRFTSECIENLFSVIRQSQPIPNAMAFLQNVKVITLAQFSEAIRGSSYDYDEVSELPALDFLEEVRQKAQERTMARFYDSLEELFRNPVRKLTDNDLKLLTRWERLVLYDMAGSTVHAILSSNETVCDSCVNALKWTGDTFHEYSTVTCMKEYSMLRSDDSIDPLQIYVSDVVFQALLTVEISLRIHCENTINFIDTDVKQYFIENLMYVWSGSNIPDCHQICRKILSKFIDGRLKEFARAEREKVKTKKAESAIIDRSSKSAAMRDAANMMKVASGR